MDNQTVNVNGLTSEQISSAITEYVRSVDLTKLSNLNVSITSEGVQFDTSYYDHVSAATIKGYNI